MSEQEKAAGEPLIHDVSTNITFGTVAQGARLPGTALAVPMRTITSEEFTAKRAKMSAICGECHSGSFVRRNLEGADQIKIDVDTLLWDPVMRVRGLWYDGLLDPMPVNRDPNPIFGQNLVLGGQQLYGGTSAIESLFFNTYKYDHVNTFKGAYHINPDYSHWFGWARVNVDRDLIKGEEAKLRRLARPYDAGFTATRLVAGKATRLDARKLLALGQRVGQLVPVVVRRRHEQRGRGEQGNGEPRVCQAGDVQGASDLRRHRRRQRPRHAAGLLGDADHDAGRQGHAQVAEPRGQAQRGTERGPRSGAAFRAAGAAVYAR